MLSHKGASKQTVPLIGAQVFIEPGQTLDNIETWFRVLEEAGMKVCRIRMFESHMHRSNGTWDYSLYDHAFRMAEKYDVKVFATLFPLDSRNSVGGEKFPENEEHLCAIAAYIEHVVIHFKQYRSLYAWVLQNEPGTGGYVPDNEFSGKAYTKWKADQPVPDYNSKGYLKETFESKRFLRDYETWFLSWIAGEVQKYDPGRHLHVNNHQIFENVAEYDFPAWRRFLTSLGASAHPSWHFGIFTRSRYAMALSANCDIIRSGAGDLPFWITELQGGNTIYSGNVPMCPTQEEIVQWLWTGIASGAKGTIFWCLNPRASAIEAGEWAMITFQDEPSDRLIAASRVIKTVNNHVSLFSNASFAETNIHILYSRESLWAETYSQVKGEKAEGKATGGVMKSALACHEALTENGIGCNFSELNEFDWEKQNYENASIILAHQISIPSAYWKQLENFVAKGGKLIVTGLTGFFDENMHNVMKTGFPLENLFGGNIREVKHAGELFEVHLQNPDYSFPAHLWMGTINVLSGQTIGKAGNEILAIRNSFGKGKVVWIPSLIELGARSSDNQSLSEFLVAEASASIASIPVRFANHEKGMLMKTMLSGENLISILINKTEDRKTIPVITLRDFRPKILFSNKTGMISDNNDLTIDPEETLVIQWGKSL
jgi:beta-galactosidase